MNPWDAPAQPQTGVAQILARCVAAGVLSQETLDSFPKDPDLFSPQLQQAEQIAAVRREIDQKSLEVELLRLEQEGADVTHPFHLSQKFEALQRFTSHLQGVLREQRSLRQRLMKPLCQQNLPVEASLHRYVVEMLGLAIDFIERLESSVQAKRFAPSVAQSVTTLENCLARLLSLVSEMEELSEQVLQWRGIQASPPALLTPGRITKKRS
ncbi:HAUS augmin-like complex subunit 2 isoform X1 [Acipenser oxyrinchus oxyrinchus]|uniref:HAUS augmin-like complex subunit 2 isoform X1 n=1 Tax=Acipenser oxyrinchus oxyrinchus TaxID=40147 RepID=A0AAD8CXD4_ACIOX|nr:HAUS augmin-like complex subunit 2 isoform X1 [Acipenser oxyrinchus oxyrinchus]